MSQLPIDLLGRPFGPAADPGSRPNAGRSTLPRQAIGSLTAPGVVPVPPVTSRGQRLAGELGQALGLLGEGARLVSDVAQIGIRAQRGTAARHVDEALPGIRARIEAGQIDLPTSLDELPGAVDSIITDALPDQKKISRAYLDAFRERARPALLQIANQHTLDFHRRNDDELTQALLDSVANASSLDELQQTAAHLQNDLFFKTSGEQAIRKVGAFALTVAAETGDRQAFETASNFLEGRLPIETARQRGRMDAAATQAKNDTLAAQRLKDQPLADHRADLQKLVNTGTLTNDEADNEFQRTVITRANRLAADGNFDEIDNIAGFLRKDDDAAQLAFGRARQQAVDNFRRRRDELLIATTLRDPAQAPAAAEQIMRAVELFSQNPTDPPPQAMDPSRAADLLGRIMQDKRAANAKEIRFRQALGAIASVTPDRAIGHLAAGTPIAVTDAAFSSADDSAILSALITAGFASPDSTVTDDNNVIFRGLSQPEAAAWSLGARFNRVPAQVRGLLQRQLDGSNTDDIAGGLRFLTALTRTNPDAAAGVVADLEGLARIRATLTQFSASPAVIGPDGISPDYLTRIGNLAQQASRLQAVELERVEVDTALWGFTAANQPGAPVILREQASGELHEQLADEFQKRGWFGLSSVAFAERARDRYVELARLNYEVARATAGQFADEDSAADFAKRRAVEQTLAEFKPVSWNGQTDLQNAPYPFAPALADQLGAVIERDIIDAGHAPPGVETLDDFQAQYFPVWNARAQGVNPETGQVDAGAWELRSRTNPLENFTIDRQEGAVPFLFVPSTVETAPASGDGDRGRAGDGIPFGPAGAARLRFAAEDELIIRRIEESQARFAEGEINVEPLALMLGRIGSARARELRELRNPTSDFLKSFRRLIRKPDDDPPTSDEQIKAVELQRLIELLREEEPVDITLPGGARVRMFDPDTPPFDVAKLARDPLGPTLAEIVAAEEALLARRAQRRRAQVLSLRRPGDPPHEEDNRVRTIPGTRIPLLEPITSNGGGR